MHDIGPIKKITIVASGSPSEEVGHNHVRYLFVLSFPYISIHVRRELNVINFGTVVLVMNILVKS